MAVTTLLFKTDKRLKKEAHAIVRAMGIPLSAYLNAQLRALVNNRSALFDLPEMPNAKTARQLKKTLHDVRSGRNISKSFDSGEELDNHLMSL